MIIPPWTVEITTWSPHTWEPVRGSGAWTWRLLMAGGHGWWTIRSLGIVTFPPPDSTYCQQLGGKTINAHIKTLFGFPFFRFKTEYSGNLTFATVKVGILIGFTQFYLVFSIRLDYEKGHIELNLCREGVTQHQSTCPRNAMRFTGGGFQGSLSDMLQRFCISTLIHLISNSMRKDVMVEKLVLYRFKQIG